MKGTKAFLIVFSALVAAVVLDRLSKLWALHNLSEGVPSPIINGFFNLTLTFNSGAAFSLLSGKNFFLIFLSVAVIFLIAYSYITLPASFVTSIATGMILGGAISNLYDRFIYGGIIDFIHFVFFPVFNLADTAISVGVLLMVHYYVREDILDKRKPISAPGQGNLHPQSKSSTTRKRRKR